MSTKFLSPGWRMPRNANQSKHSNYSLLTVYDEGIDLGTTMSITGNLSVSGWFKVRGSTQNYSILATKYLAPSLTPYYIFVARINSSGGVEWRIGTDTANPQKYYSVNSTTIVRDSNNWQGNWFHFTGTWDGVNIKIYINGVLEGTTAAYGKLDTTAGLHTSIAAAYLNNQVSSFGLLNGEVNNVAFFDYALSASQVTTLYGDSTNGPGNPMALPSPPIAYYPLSTSAWNGQYLAENNAIGDYVFDFIPNDYIQTGGFTIGNNYSFSCWLKSDTTSPSNMCFLSSPNYYTIGYDGNFVIRFTTATQIQMFSYNERSDSESSTVTIPSIDTNWHHFALTSNGTTTNIYWDGSPLTVTGNQTKSLDNILQGLIIGDNITRNNNAFDGELSNVQIFNTALLGSEVETLYNYGSPIQTLANIPQNSNLKAWYKLDASEIYNSTSTEWEVSDATAAIKNTILDPQNSSPRPYYEENNGGNLLPLTGTAGQSITISFWYYADGNADNIIFGRIQNSAYWFGKQSTNNLRFLFTGNSGWTLGPSVPRNQWNHIVLTVVEGGSGVGRTVKFYVNGGSPTTVTDSISYLSNWSNSFQKNTFGAGSYSSTNVDVLSSNYIYYNTALLDSEVTNLYNSFSPDSENTPTVQPALSNFPKNSNITGWFKSDGLDSSGEGNNASGVGDILVGPAVSLRNGASSGMSQSNLVQSDLQTVAPYSKYALSFDGVNDYIETLNNGPNITQVTLSAWIKRSGTQSDYNGVLGVRNSGGAPHYGISWDLAFQSSPSSTNKIQFRVGDGANAYKLINSNSAIPDNTWTHIAGVLNGTNVLLYINGSLQTETETFTGTLLSPSSKIFIGSQGPSGNNEFVGSISNPAVWNTGLSASEVREIYNEGLPSNLNTFSGTAPIAWWQLGENSSFNGNDWIVADEIGSNNGESNGMGVDALTNGVGTTANGVSTGMSEGSLVGDAPYSTANAISSGIPVTARGTDVPPTP